MNTEARAKIIASLTNQVARIEAEQITLSRALVKNNYVIMTAPSVYLRLMENGAIGAGVSHCTRFTEERARALAPDITNGYGERAQAMPLRSALAAEAAHMRELLETLTAVE